MAPLPFLLASPPHILRFRRRVANFPKAQRTIVSPDTFLRWIGEDKRAKKKGRKAVKRGRPRTAEQIRELILLMAKENNWGYARIVGELRKLGIRSIAKSTLRNILKEAGLDPCPKRAAAPGMSSSAATRPACGNAISSHRKC
jgi:putative transposase